MNSIDRLHDEFESNVSAKGKNDKNKTGDIFIVDTEVGANRQSH